MDAFIQRWRDELILLGRVLMMLLFVISGWGKLTGFQGTTGIYNFRPDLHQGITVNPFVLATIEGGKVKVVQ